MEWKAQGYYKGEWKYYTPKNQRQLWGGGVLLGTGSWDLGEKVVQVTNMLSRKSQFATLSYSNSFKPLPHY